MINQFHILINNGLQFNNIKTNITFNMKDSMEFISLIYYTEDLIYKLLMIYI